LDLISACLSPNDVEMEKILFRSELFGLVISERFDAPRDTILNWFANRPGNQSQALQFSNSLRFK